MKKIIQFEEANQILNPYYESLVKCLNKCFEECNKMCDIFSSEQPVSFKNRTKGSFIADLLKVFAKKEFESDPNIRFVEIRGAFGIVIAEKIVIRFNKMDSKFRVSVNQKTKTSKKFMNQLPIDGLENLTYVWGGYNPDKTWNTILGYYLTCFNGNLNWHYDMERNKALQQLSIDMPTKMPEKRVRPKKRNDDPIEKTGTND